LCIGANPESNHAPKGVKKNGRLRAANGWPAPSTAHAGGGDVFYLHSHLLERAAKMGDAAGN
jgi:hypothetical protein